MRSTKETARLSKGAFVFKTFKTAAMALTLCIVATGCNLTVSTDKQDQGSGGGETQAAPSETPSSDSQQSSNNQQVSSTDQPAVPTGYILDQSCERGSGSTGLDIYYAQPPTGSLRFVCVHPPGKSPYVTLEDAQLDQNLADVGGPYCAYSTVSQNVGCALSPISEEDLMNVPPQEQEVPAGYVLEDCQQGIGATGKTIYFSPPLPPEPGGRMHTYWFTCVHRAEDGAIVNVAGSPGSPPRIMGNANPYCAFSTVSKNVGCALEPITSKDLMSPS